VCKTSEEDCKEEVGFGWVSLEWDCDVILGWIKFGLVRLGWIKLGLSGLVLSFLFCSWFFDLLWTFLACFGQACSGWF